MLSIRDEPNHGGVIGRLDDDVGWFTVISVQGVQKGAENASLRGSGAE